MELTSKKITFVLFSNPFSDFEQMNKNTSLFVHILL